MQPNFKIPPKDTNILTLAQFKAMLKSILIAQCLYKIDDFYKIMYKEYYLG